MASKEKKKKMEEEKEAGGYRTINIAEKCVNKQYALKLTQEKLN